MDLGQYLKSWQWWPEEAKIISLSKGTLKSTSARADICDFRHWHLWLRDSTGVAAEVLSENLKQCMLVDFNPQKSSKQYF